MDPYEDQQLVILKRIMSNVDKVLESTLALNDALATVNSYNQKNVEVAEMWKSYIKNTEFNLKSHGELQRSVEVNNQRK